MLVFKELDKESPITKGVNMDWEKIGVEVGQEMGEYSDHMPVCSPGTSNWYECQHIPKRIA